MQRSPVLFRRKRRILRIQGPLSAVAHGNCCSYGSNRAGLGLRWCRFPTRPPKPHTRLHRAEFWFSLQNELTPPPKGGGAGYHLTWLTGILMQRSPVLFRRKRRMLRIRGLLSAVACGNCRPQPGYAGPTGLIRGLGGVAFPYPALKTAHRRSQGRVWFHSRFLVCFCSGSDTKSRSSL